MKDLVDQIMPQILSLKKLAKSQLPALQAELNFLIDTHSQDGNRIENLLDNFLNFMMLGVGEAQFIQLLEYYKTVDQEGAADYWRYYEEMLAEE
jgi:hypothetical protein